MANCTRTLVSIVIFVFIFMQCTLFGRHHGVLSLLPSWYAAEIMFQIIYRNAHYENIVLNICLKSF